MKAVAKPVVAPVVAPVAAPPAPIAAPPVAKPVVVEAPAPVVKPAPAPVAKAAPAPVVKAIPAPAVKASPTPVAKPAVKAVPKTMVKPAVKAASKPITKTLSKPAAAPVTKPTAAASTTAPAPKVVEPTKPTTTAASKITTETTKAAQTIKPEAVTPAKVASTRPAVVKRPVVAPKAVVKARPKTFLKTEPLSFGQSRFWFLRLLLEDQTTSNVAFYYHIAGNMHFGKMEKAIRTVTARHESLRTCFIEDENRPDQAFQKVMSSSPLRLERKSIASFDEVAIEYAELQKHVFDLASGDLVRLLILSLSPTSHYLLVNYHHIVMDGVSFQIFLSDLEKAYDGKPLGKLPQQYPDFTAAQRKAYESGGMDADVKYWREQFPEGEQPPVLPLLPMARVSGRGAMKKFGVHQVGARMDADLVARIKAVSKAQQSTPFHFYLAAYKAMLFSFTQAKDLTIGIADANRRKLRSKV